MRMVSFLTATPSPFGLQGRTRPVAPSSCALAPSRDLSLGHGDLREGGGVDPAGGPLLPRLYVVEGGTSGVNYAVPVSYGSGLGRSLTGRLSADGRLGFPFEYVILS